MIIGARCSSDAEGFPDRCLCGLAAGYGVPLLAHLILCTFINDPSQGHLAIWPAWALDEESRRQGPSSGSDTEDQGTVSPPSSGRSHACRESCMGESKGPLRAAHAYATLEKDGNISVTPKLRE